MDLIAMPACRQPWSLSLGLRAILAGAVGSACSTPVSTPPITVKLANESFATSGANLFNCGSPANPPNQVALTNAVLDCTPETNADGTYSSTPATVTAQLACSDGHGALVVVTCAGVEGTSDVSGSVAISITADCSTRTLDPDANTFPYASLAPGMVEGQDLQSCATFSNLCSTGNPCGFNEFSLTASVAYHGR